MGPWMIFLVSFSSSWSSNESGLWAQNMQCRGCQPTDVANRCLMQFAADMTDELTAVFQRHGTRKALSVEFDGCQHCFVSRIEGASNHDKDMERGPAKSPREFFFFTALLCECLS